MVLTEPKRNTVASACPFLPDKLVWGKKDSPVVAGSCLGRKDLQLSLMVYGEEQVPARQLLFVF